MDDMNAMNGANAPGTNPADPNGRRTNTNQYPYGATQQTWQNNSAPQHAGTGVPPYQPMTGTPVQPGNPNQQYNQGGNYGAPPAMAFPLNKPFYGCPPMEAVKRFFVKYVNFNGRASRSEFWWTALFLFIVNMVISLINSVVLDTDESFINVIWAIAILLPCVAISIRRLHDTNKSGWWLLLPALIVLVSTIVLVALLLFTGYQVAALSNTDIAQAIANGAGIELIIGASLLLICYLAAFVIYVVFMAMEQKPEGAQYDETAPAQPVMQNMVQGQQMPPMNQQPFGSANAARPMNPSTNTAMPQNGQGVPGASYNQQPSMPNETGTQPGIPNTSGEQPHNDGHSN